MTLLQVLRAMLLALALPLSAISAEWQGTVVGVADGDTLTLLDASHTQHRIRLDGIDAPERTQPYGQRARQSLAALAHGRVARADCPKVDRYGRAVCRVIVDGWTSGSNRYDAAMRGTTSSTHTNSARSTANGMRAPRAKRARHMPACGRSVTRYRPGTIAARRAANRAGLLTATRTRRADLDLSGKTRASRC